MAEKAAIKAAAQKRFTATVGVLTSIKSAMRDPDSLKWQDIRANDDGSVVCVVYRARNGFGGMNLEHASFAGKSISTSDASWNKHCANKSLYEMGHAKFASSLT
ncbi:hypothetical protein [Massilia sp. Leaf139]|uniref:hypothetical protein n=1 Tax=Massilia sp. Leaf139 TaxID=1736272 RepID=UPI0012E8BC8D|nr:hypothetical protein [Massilia sp. Leaf139]